MPYINRFNPSEWCSGVAGVGSYYGVIDNDVIHELLALPDSGGAQWLNDKEIITQYFGTGVAQVVAFHKITGAQRTITEDGCNDLTADNNGHWAKFFSNGVSDNFPYTDEEGKFHPGRNFPLSGLGPMGQDGAYAIKTLYNSFGPWDNLFPDNTRLQFTSGDARDIVNYGFDRLTWTEGGILKSQKCPTPIPLTKEFWWFRFVFVEDEVWQLYQTPLGIFFHELGKDIGHNLGTGNFYYPDQVVLSDGRVRIIWSNSAQDIPSNLIARTFNPHENQVKLVNVVEPPQPSSEIMIKAFERPMWMAPFWSHSEKYGNTPIADHLGNSIWTTRDDFENNKQYNFPLIVAINQGQTIGDENLVIAYYVSSGNISELVNNVNYALNLPERPIIAYLDGDGWPDSNPFSNDVSKRVWPSIQAYRFAGETITAFSDRVGNVINRVINYVLPMVLTPRYDDFNGSQTIAAIEECMPYYEAWLRNFNFVGHMPFSDRRGNAIRNNPSLQSHARSFLYAIPSGRPNRFDYWIPEGQTIEQTLKNKFGQSRAAIVMEPYLRTDILNHYEDNPNPPEPPSPGGIPNNDEGFSVVKEVYDPHPPDKTVEAAFFFCKAVASRLTFTGALQPESTPEHEVRKKYQCGLLLKPGGDNIFTYNGKTYSASRICFPDGHIVKVLSDVPGTNGESWQDEGEIVEIDRYVSIQDV